MTISEFIEQLEALKSKHGDLKVEYLAIQSNSDYTEPLAVFQPEEQCEFWDSNETYTQPANIGLIGGPRTK
jgi:hypothetical protein